MSAVWKLYPVLAESAYPDSSNLLERPTFLLFQILGILQEVGANMDIRGSGTASCKDSCGLGAA